MRDLNRLESIGEMIRHALNSIAVVAPAWLRQIAPSEWYERYSERVEEYRLPRKKQERQALAEAIGAEGVYLLTSIYESDSHQWLRELPAVELLRRAWVHQFYYMFPQPATIEDLDPGTHFVKAHFQEAGRGQ